MKEVILKAVKGLYKESFIPGLEVAVKFAKTYAEGYRFVFDREESSFQNVERGLLSRVFGKVEEGSLLWNYFGDLLDALMLCVQKAEEDEYRLFIDYPDLFYSRLMDYAEQRNLKRFEPALFTTPCSVCGKPIVFTHKNSNWKSKVRPTLLEAFRYWHHTKHDLSFSTS